MRYRVYSAPQGTKDVSLLKQNELLFKEFGTIDEALSWATHLSRGGRTALLLEGDDGTRMNKREIAEAVGIGERQKAAG